MMLEQVGWGDCFCGERAYRTKDPQRDMRCFGWETTPPARNEGECRRSKSRDARVKGSGTDLAASSFAGSSIPPSRQSGGVNGGVNGGVEDLGRGNVKPTQRGEPPTGLAASL